MARSATTRYAVLGMLTQRPMTGYKLREEITGSIGHFWSESFGQLYPTLRELAADGLVEGHAAGTRRRIEYSVTDAGLQALRHWLAEDVETLTSARNELLLKLFFGRHAEPGVLQGHLAEHHAALAQALARYRTLESAVLEEPEPDTRYWLATIRYGIAVTEAGLSWTAATLGSLEGDAAAGDAAHKEERP